MLKGYDCESIEQARKMFPELKNCLCTEVEFKDGILVLFSELELTDSDKDLFKQFTKYEFRYTMSLSFNA